MKKINQNTIWFKAVQYQSNICGVRLPESICSYWWRVFVIFGIIPAYLYLLVTGLYLIIGPGELRNTAMDFGRLLVVSVTSVLAIAAGVFYIGWKFQECEKIDYD